MRFRELRLEAFGPFTDQLIDFGPESETDLQVIFGPNEAGKSSTLRAIDALLFGIPARTNDDFVHGYAKLRLTAVLQAAGHDPLTVTRVKGNKGTLLDETGKPVAEELIERLLDGVDQADFQRLYLLNAAKLAAGAESLLAGGGEFGVSIFGATLGSSGLPAAARRLHQRAEAIYKSTGRNPPLNSALSAYSSHMRDAKQLGVNPKAFSDAEEAVARIEAEREAQRKTVAEIDQRVQTLQRLSSLTTPFARRTQLWIDLGAYEGVPELAPDAAARRELASQQQQGAIRRLSESEARRAILQGEIAALCGNRPELGAGDGTTTVSPLASAQTELIAELSEQHVQLQARLAAAAQQLAERQQAYERQRQSTESTPASTPDASALAAWTQSLEEAAPALISARELQRENESSLRAVLRAAAALAPALSEDQLAALPLPAGPDLAAHAELQIQLRERRERLSEEVEQRRVEIEQERLALTGSGSELVEQAEADLHQARTQRDAQLQRLGQSLSVERLETARTLHQELSGSVRLTDERADALLSEADRVARTRQAGDRIAELRRQIDRRDQQLVELERDDQELADDWSRLWSASKLTPNASAAAMSEWYAEVLRLRDEAARLREQIASHAQTITDGAGRAAHVRHELTGLGISVDDHLPDPQLIKQARATLAEIDAQAAAAQAAQTQTERLKDEYEQARNNHQAIGEELERWQHRWQDALAVRPTLDPTRPVAQIRETVALINELAGKQRELAELVRARVSDERDRDEAETTLSELLTVAGCERVEDLPEVERRATTRDGLLRSLAECERELLEHGRRPLDELAKELAGRDADALASELDGEQRLLDEARERYDELGNQATAARAERDHLDTGIDAAVAREAAERDAAEIGELVERYLAAVSASTLLGRAIARHREEHASPILARAGELLAQLTNGSLTRLEVDDSDADQPVIRVRRGTVAGANDPDSVSVAAALTVAELSEGTRDQLYLALRLAALEHQLRARQPQPLLLDDVLTSYDEARVSAALRAFATVAQRTQVILFTHHQHVAAAAAALPDHAARVHRLSE